MGGNAIMQKGFNSVRANREVYFSIKNRIEEILKGEIYIVPPELTDKYTFGDIDVIVQYNTPEDIKNIYNKFMNIAEIDGYSKNKTIYSLAYRVNPKCLKYLKNPQSNIKEHKEHKEYFQVDLIFVKERDFNSTAIYSSFGDMFNLLGRISKRIGAKLSCKGFEYIVRVNGKVVGEVILTNDFRKIFEVLGLDYEYFMNGLGNGTQKDVFDFVISSRYFSKDLFSSEHSREGTATNKTKGRPGIKAFLDYLGHLDTADIKDTKDTKDTKQNKDKVLDFFPEKLEEIQRLKDLAILKEKVSKKFNGKIVQEILGLKGKELGEFMKKFKKTYTLHEIIDMENIEEVIRGLIRAYEN